MCLSIVILSLILILLVGVVSYFLFIKKSKNEIELTIEIGIHSTQGRRREMEDAHVVLPDLTDDSLSFSPIFKHFPPNSVKSFVGVYDGHRGSKCAEFVAEHLHQKIFQEPSLIGSQSNDVQKAIINGFKDTDEKWIEEIAKKHKLLDGSTSVTALILGKTLYIANLGDSEALLVKRKEDGITFDVLTFKHKPSEESEKQRIVANGGMVFGGRVGGLSVSRSFGDMDIKIPHSEDGFSQGVLMSAEPYLHSPVELNKSEDLFLIIGCDGVWEAMKHQASVDFVCAKLKERKEEKGVEEKSMDDICQALVTEAIRKGSCDNVTCSIITFNWT